VTHATLIMLIKFAKRVNLETEDNFMEKYLDIVNNKVDVVFSLMEKLCSICFDFLTVFFKHAYAWSVFVGVIALILISFIGLIKDFSLYY